MALVKQFFFLPVNKSLQVPVRPLRLSPCDIQIHSSLDTWKLRLSAGRLQNKHGRRPGVTVVGGSTPCVLAGFVGTIGRDV